MTGKEAEQIRRTLALVQKLEREVQRELAELAQAESLGAADFGHVSEATRKLMESREVLMQLSEGLTVSTEEAIAVPAVRNGRGREKQYYLKDNTKRGEMVEVLKGYFEQYYEPGTRHFVLKDGVRVNAHTFLACLYDLGIRDGMAGEDAPVNDFADMAREAAEAAGMSQFRTAYNTIQHVTRKWREMAGARGYGERTIHLYMLQEEDVDSERREEYRKAVEVMARVEEVWGRIMI